MFRSRESEGVKFRISSAKLKVSRQQEGVEEFEDLLSGTCRRLVRLNSGMPAFCGFGCG